jgi:hypothetical protein
MTRLLLALSLVLPFYAAQAETPDATDLANALLKASQSGPAFAEFSKHTTGVTSADFQDLGNGKGVYRIGGHYLNIDMVCGISELVIRREVVQQFFGPATVYRATTTHKKLCP